METVLTAVVFFIIAIVFMGLALTFAKYKKGKSACCHGAEHDSHGGGCCGAHVENKSCEH
ncbi:MAG: hypothetical protein ACEPO8_13230 [Rhodothermaceae bacterium]